MKKWLRPEITELNVYETREVDLSKKIYTGKDGPITGGENDGTSVDYGGGVIT